MLDHPHRHTGRLLRRSLAEFAGGLMVFLGLLATIAAVPSSFFMVGLALAAGAKATGDPEPFPPEGFPAGPTVLVWAISTPVAVIGLVGGLRILRAPRGVVLFLRRFGYDDATRVVSFAVNETLSGAWRLVTLDDAEVAPVGVASGTRLAVRAWKFASTAAIDIGRRVAFQVFPTAVTVMWAIVGLQILLVIDDWRAFLDDGRAGEYFDILEGLLSLDLPFAAVGLSLPGAFAAVGIVAALSFLGLGVVFAALLLAFPLAGLLFFLGESTGAVLKAEQSKTSEIRTEQDIGTAAHTITAARGRVFAPRLLVLRVANGIWQPAVSRLASIASVSLVDVSEPTDPLIWELEELERAGARSVLVGHHERVSALAAPPPGDANSVDSRLRALIDGRDVLAYTTDRRGMRRFARALQGQLLTVTHDAGR